MRIFKESMATSRLWESNPPIPLWWWFSEAGKRCIQRTYSTKGFKTKLVNVYASSLMSLSLIANIIEIECSFSRYRDRIDCSLNVCMPVGRVGYSMNFRTSGFGWSGTVYFWSPRICAKGERLDISSIITEVASFSWDENIPKIRLIHKYSALKFIIIPYRRLPDSSAAMYACTLLYCITLVMNSAGLYGPSLRRETFRVFFTFSTYKLILFIMLWDITG